MNDVVSATIPDPQIAAVLEECAGDPQPAVMHLANALWGDTERFGPYDGKRPDPKRMRAVHDAAEAAVRDYVAKKEQE